MKKWITKIFILFLLAGAAVAENTPVFKQQTIEIEKAESSVLWKHWADINGDGLTDLLTFVQNQEKASTYIQSGSGFREKPTQSITFPQDTMWFKLFDISAHPGDEMLISTSEGLVFYRQNNGVFELKPQKLIEAKQVVPQNHPPIVTELRNPDDPYAIPIVFSDHTVIYKCDENYQLRPERKIEHQFKWSMSKSDWSYWNLDSKTSGQLRIIMEAQGKLEDDNNEKEPDLKKENESIQKLIEKTEKDYDGWRHGIEKKDVNADGREDFVLWYIDGELDMKTTIAVFLRKDDGKLPDKPTQILRCRGVPMHFHEWERHFLVLNDIDNDGLFEILVADLKKIPISADSMVDMLISKGTEFTISIRQFKKTRGYSNKADFKMDVTTLLPISDWVASLVTFNGDFNADGRKDLIVKRSPTLCEIYLSSQTSEYYDSEPKLKFEVPPECKISPSDLNNDGISDIYLIDHKEGRITLFLSESPNKKGSYSDQP